MVTKLGYNTTVFPDARAILECNNVGLDLIMCLLGNKISEGNFRTVYEHALDPTKVIKVEYGDMRKTEHDCLMKNTFCNIQEFLMYREIQGLQNKLEWVKNWFAPIHWISPSGHVLCMEKTLPIPERPLPDKIPGFMYDIKKANFGWIGDNFVCHDYAHVQAFTGYGKKMQKVDWD